MSADGDRWLGPGAHPPARGRYSYWFRGNLLHADPDHATDLFAGGLRTWDDPLVEWSLRAARANPAIGEEVKALLPWALTTVTAASLGGIGLAGPASYSGPGATSLEGNLSHSTRAAAYAAELVVAACLVYRGWPAAGGGPSLGLAREQGARLDFGVKLVGGQTGRRTAEADILLSLPDGSRHGVDVKFSRLGIYRSAPSAAMLAVVAEAVARGELQAFHFVSPGRFRPAFKRAVAGLPGIHVHEHVWPTPEDVARIGAQEQAAIDYGRIVREARERAPGEPDAPPAALADEAARAYWRATPGLRKLDEITTKTGFTYLYDSTIDAPHTEPPPRLVAGWGTSTAGGPSRDRSFMRGFPLPPSAAPLDRGHLIARAAGGDEGIGLNLIPQDRRLNRGSTPRGKAWRRLERLAASHPGARLFARALYDDPTDIPVRLDYLLLLPDAPVVIERFHNRPDAP